MTNPKVLDLPNSHRLRAKIATLLSVYARICAIMGVDSRLTTMLRVAEGPGPLRA